MKITKQSEFIVLIKQLKTQEHNNNLSTNLEIKQWKPDFFNIFPPGYPNSLIFLFYWLYFYILKRNHNYSVWLAYKGRDLAYQSVTFPPFWRFQFMKQNEIQIGMVYTKPIYRNQGIATEMVKQISYNQKVNVWYITTPENLVSIHVALKNGFKFYAKCVKKEINLPILRHLAGYRIIEIL